MQICERWASQTFRHDSSLKVLCLGENVRTGVHPHTPNTHHTSVFLFFPHLTLPLHVPLKGFILLNCGYKKGAHPVSLFEKKPQKCPEIGWEWQWAPWIIHLLHEGKTGLLSWVMTVNGFQQRLAFKGYVTAWGRFSLTVYSLHPQPAPLVAELCNQAWKTAGGGSVMKGCVLHKLATAPFHLISSWTNAATQLRRGPANKYISLLA